MGEVKSGLNSKVVSWLGMAYWFTDIDIDMLKIWDW